MAFTHETATPNKECPFQVSTLEVRKENQERFLKPTLSSSVVLTPRYLSLTQSFLHHEIAPGQGNRMQEHTWLLEYRTQT